MKIFRSSMIVVGLLGLLNCTSEDEQVAPFQDDASLTSLDGEWKVISFEDYGSGKVEVKTQENSWDKDILLTFNEDILTGTNTTNRVQGELEYLGQRRFNVISLVSTSVNQPEWANKFVEAILSDDLTFKINANGLRIYYDDGSRSVTFAKH